jgi:hypothetical protein
MRVAVAVAEVLESLAALVVLAAVAQVERRR